MTVKKDGYLNIEFMDGESMNIPFEGTRGWDVDDKSGCLIVRYDDHHDRYPFANIRRFGPYYNSPEVSKALTEESYGAPAEAFMKWTSTKAHGM